MSPCLQGLNFDLAEEYRDPEVATLLGEPFQPQAAAVASGKRVPRSYGVLQHRRQWQVRFIKESTGILCLNLDTKIPNYRRFIAM